MTEALITTLAVILAFAGGVTVGRCKPPRQQVWRTLSVSSSSPAFWPMRQAATLAFALGATPTSRHEVAVGGHTLTIAWLSGTTAGDIIEDAMTQNAIALNPEVGV
jgi:hypothetical protein